MTYKIVMMHEVCCCERLGDPRRDAHSCMAQDLRKSERQVLPLWARD
jgi:hypothetical protein